MASGGTAAVLIPGGFFERHTPMDNVMERAAGAGGKQTAKARTPRKRPAKAPAAHLVRLSGALGIGTVRDLHCALREAIDAGCPVTLDAAAVEAVDTAALQLLYAFVRDGRERGIEIVWKAPPERLQRDAERLGLGAPLGLTSA